MINHLKRAEIEREEKWLEWISKIPIIKFNSDWEVKIIPPFAGAMARFWIKRSDGETRSVYLDCYDALGCVGEPYWEVYPFEGDVGRCQMNDVEKLLAMLRA